MGAVNWSGTLRIPAHPRWRCRAAPVSGTFFDVLGASRCSAHVCTKDDEPSAAPVIVLSHATWTQYFGADPNVIGRKVPMNGEGRRRSSRSSA